MQIENRGRRTVIVSHPTYSEHSMLTGDSLEEVWAYVDSRSARFKENGDGKWSVTDLQDQEIGRITLPIESATVKNNSRSTGRRV